jgi:hypothetical protein
VQCFRGSPVSLASIQPKKLWLMLLSHKSSDVKNYRCRIVTRRRAERNMNINENFHDQIRKLDVNLHKTACEYKYWKDAFKGDAPVLQRLAKIEKTMGKTFGRLELVDFYKSAAEIKTKFLAAMIWGHEAPAGGRRDARGPWKVEQMFKSLENSTVLDDVRVANNEEITTAYSNLDNAINKCGPSFITKHLYFLGKSMNTTSYPLIFDNRVSVGLVKISMNNPSCLNLVTIQAKRKAHAYVAYLRFAKEQANSIGCELDQIEYFLFEHGR